MINKTLRKPAPKPTSVAKRGAQVPALTEPIETAYEIEITAEAREKLKDVVQAVEYLNQEAARAAAITVSDDATDREAADAIVNLTKARKHLEDLRSYFTSPLEARKKIVIAWFKERDKEPGIQEARLREEGGRYFMKKRDEQLAEQRRQQQEQAERDRKARQLGRAPVELPPAPPPAPVERTKEAENGTVSFGTEWTFEVVDLALVPEAFIVRDVNKKAAQGAIDGGARSIPGLRIFERPKSAVR